MFAELSSPLQGPGRTRWFIGLCFSVLLFGGASHVIAEDEWNQGKLKIEDQKEALREKGWDHYGSIAIGAGFSVAFQSKQTHPLQAEYFQRVLLFAGSDRRGGLSGALRLRANTGGRMHVLLYRYLDAEGVPTHVSFEDRYGEQVIDLNKVDFVRVPEGSKREYVGTLSGAAFPYKFFTPPLLTEKEARRRLK